MDASLELKKAWKNPKTRIYLSKNVDEIDNYLKQHGFKLERKEIRRFLDLEKTDVVSYKNYGKREIAETSKSFVQRESFFANVHADLMVLSKKRKYGTSNQFILVVVDQLSRWIFLRSCRTTKFVSQKQAWDSIFKSLCDMGKNYSIEACFHDGGVEFCSLEFKRYLKEKNVRDNLIRRRAFRLSKNSPYAESAIRRVRHNLEKVMIEKVKWESFDQLLKKVENMCNKQVLSSIGMSAKEALHHEPGYVVLVSESKKLKREKYRRKLMNNNVEISLKSVVKIKKNVDKEFSSVSKESYGHLSHMFVVTGVDKSRAIWYYTVANLFTLEPLKGSFSRAELLLIDIDFVEACEKESRNLRNVVSVQNGIVQYNVHYNDIVFEANESLIDG